MAGPGDIDHIEVILLNDPIKMQVDEILARCRTPVANHQRFYMPELERLFKKWIVVEVNLTDRQVISCPPVCVELVDLFRGKRVLYHGLILLFAYSESGKPSAQS